MKTLKCYVWSSVQAFPMDSDNTCIVLLLLLKSQFLTFSSCWSVFSIYSSISYLWRVERETLIFCSYHSITQFFFLSQFGKCVCNYLSIYLLIYKFIYLSIYLSVCRIRKVFVSICLSSVSLLWSTINIFVNYSPCFGVCLSLPLYLSNCQSFYLPI